MIEAVPDFQIYPINSFHAITRYLKSSFNIKYIPVRGCGGPYGCETSRLPHFLDHRLTDGSEVIRLKRRTPFTPRKIPGTNFC
jgi:hypothetical protein